MGLEHGRTIDGNRAGTGTGDWTGAYTVFLAVKDQFDKLMHNKDVKR